MEEYTPTPSHAIPPMRPGMHGRFGKHASSLGSFLEPETMTKRSGLENGGAVTARLSVALRKEARSSWTSRYTTKKRS